MFGNKNNKVNKINESDFYNIKYLEKFKSDFSKISLKDKKNVSILFIDDLGFDVEPLKQLGYKDVDVLLEFNDIKSVQPYDIIFCDINDVAKKHFPVGQGAELASTIKRMYPDKYVVIFSAQNHKNSFYKYYEDVDDVIDKTSGYGIFCNVIDKYINIQNDPIEYWGYIEKRMYKQKINNVVISKMEHYYVSSLIDKKNYYKKQKFLDENSLVFVSSFIELFASIVQLYLSFIK